MSSSTSRHSSLRERVLVDADGFYGVLAGIRGLRAAGFRPWVLTPRRGTYAALTRAAEGRLTVPAPLAERDAFVAAAADAAARLEAELVLPGTEGGLVALAGRQEAFPAGTRVGAPAAEVVARATDKDVLARLAPNAGLDTPPTVALRRDELDGAELQFPLVVKPVRTQTPGADGALAHGRVQIVHDRASLARAAAALPGDEVLLQERVEGSLEAVGGVAWEGRVVCSVHQRALRIAPPEAGISALAVTVPRDPALDAAVARLIEALGWSGIFQIQLVRSGSRAYAIDLNPRMYGSMALAIAAGANLPAIWAELVAGREPTPADYRVGVHYRSEEKELQALVLALGRRDWRTVADCVRPRRDTTHSAFALRDPLPLAAGLRRPLAGLLRRG